MAPDIGKAIHGILTGMDVAQVRSLARLMQTEAADIEHQSRVLTQQIESAPWVGKDRNDYLDTWRTTHVAALQRVSDALRDASKAAGRYADQQEWASRPDGV